MPSTRSAGRGPMLVVDVLDLTAEERNVKYRSRRR